MDIESNTDTQSSYESLILSKDENQKSPESSDCEGYATPLASSLTNLSSVTNHGITINVPDYDTEYDEKLLDSGELTPVSTNRASSPPIVKQVMFLQKPNILVMTQREINDEEYNVQRDSEGSSEDEFYDVDDDQIRDVAQKLIDAVSESEEDLEEDEDVEEQEERMPTPFLADDVTNVSSESGSVESNQVDTNSEELEIESVVAEVTEELLTTVESATQEFAEEVVPEGDVVEIGDEKKSNDEEEEHETTIKTPLEMEEHEVTECLTALQNGEDSADKQFDEQIEEQNTEDHFSVNIQTSTSEPEEDNVESESPISNDVQNETSVTDAEEINEEPMPTLVISDEVKTVENRVDDDLSDCSMQEVKVDFDGYSSGKEESLSSSTSTESFEFADSVPSPHSDERALALRNSIIERYPSNETDDDELDDVEYDEDLLAVKQISAEVEQLVAAINAFGRDEEQQMSAYLVGKKMAAEKKRKSAMETGVSNCQDQLVQTDNDFILVDKHLPEEMESLQVEIDSLQADLEKFKAGEKELLRINGKLQEDLQEAQQTIDGIEVEAEQQYTELTSEIDELCDIVLKKDQELATLKERVANLSVSEINLKDDVDGQRVIVQRQKEIIEGLREELDAFTKKLGEVTKLRDKAIEEATIYKMKNMERERFLSKEAQMSMEIEDLQRELNKQKLILNQTSMAKLADTFDRKVLHLENELRERDMLICKQNQIINSHRKSPTGSIITQRKMQPRASVLAAAGNLPSAGSSSESFQNGLDVEAKEALLSFILSDRHNQLANIYNIGRILDLSPHEERAVERHLTKDRFT